MLKTGTIKNTGPMFLLLYAIKFFQRLLGFLNYKAWPTSKLVDNAYWETLTGGEKT